MRATGTGTYAHDVTSLLLVEDDERISQPLVRLLQHEGFDVTHVATGQGGLAAAHESPPDLVLLDLSLPDLDGLEVCRVGARHTPGDADRHADRSR